MTSALLTKDGNLLVNIAVADGTIEATSSTIEAKLDTANTHLNAIDVDVGSSLTYLGNISSKATSIDIDTADIVTNTSTINTSIGTTNTNLSTINTTIGTSNTTLTSIDGHVDGLETLVGTTNTNLSTINTTIGTSNTTLSSIDGHVDGLETLVGTTNTNLSTINTTIGTSNTTLTSIDGHVDGLETLVGTTNTNLSTINTTVSTTVGTSNTHLSNISGYTSSIPSQGHILKTDTINVGLAHEDVQMEEIFSDYMDTKLDERLWTKFYVNATGSYVQTTGYMEFRGNASDSLAGIVTKRAMEFLPGYKYELVFDAKFFMQNGSSAGYIGLASDLPTSSDISTAMTYGILIGVYGTNKVANIRYTDAGGSLTTVDDTSFNGTYTEIYNTWQTFKIELDYSARPAIRFFQKAYSGKWQLMHTVQDSATNEFQRFTFPRMKIIGYSQRPAGSSSNTFVDVASFAFYRQKFHRIARTSSPDGFYGGTAQTNGTGTKVHVFTIQNPSTFSSQTNNRSLKINYIRASTDSSGIPAKISAYLDSTLSGASFSALTTYQPGDVDTAATISSVGTLVFQTATALSTTTNPDNLYITPGSTLTFTVELLVGSTNEYVCVDTCFSVV